MKNFLQVNRALRAKKNFNFNFKSLLVLSAVLLLCNAQMWGTDFTPAEIASGTTTSGISVSSSFSKSTGQKLCTSQTSEDAIQLNSSAGGTYNDKYVWITVPANCKITNVGVLTKANGTTACTGAAVYWSGVAATNGVTSTETIAAGSNGTSDCTGKTTLTVPANTRTVGIYRAPKISNGAFNGSGTAVGGTSTFKIFALSVTATGTVTHTLTNVSKSSGGATATLGSEYNASYAASSGYTLPSTITVTINGSAATSGTDYTWTSSTGALTVPAAKVNGAIVVTISGEAAASNTYTYTGQDNSWGSTAMTVSDGGLYEYIHSTRQSDHQFKIKEGENYYNWTYTFPGFCMTNLTTLGNQDGNNCKVWDTPSSYYIIVFKPNTTLNSSSNPRIATSTTLPDDTEEGLAKTKMVYLVPGSGWETSSPKYAVYYEGHSRGWSDYMTASPCIDGAYQVEIPALFSSVQFMRMNPEGGKSWNDGDYWNYTAMVTMPTNKPKFTVNLTNADWNSASTDGSNWATVTTYTISFNANKGSGSMSSITGIDCNTSRTLPAIGTDITRSGWTFVGWNTDKYGGGTSYADGATISNITSNITLYAQWQRKIYFYSTTSNWYDDDAVTQLHCWDNDDDSKNLYVTMTRSDDCSDPIVYEATISGGGYDKLQFKRLKSDESESWNETVDLDFNSSYNMYKLTNMTGGKGDKAYGADGFDANYSAPSQYTITFAANGGSGSMSAIEDICEETDQDLTANGFTAPTGYKFAGWKTNAALTYVAYGDDDDGTHEVSAAVDDIVPDKAKIKEIGSDITLTAQWTGQEYKITYKDQGDVTFSGLHESGKPSAHTYGSETILKTAFKDSYVFGGWYTSSDCSTGLVTSIGATDYTANFKLYAKWTEMSMGSLAAGTLYKVGDMVPKGYTLSSTARYYPGVSANNLFNIRGSSTSSSSADAGMASKTIASRDVDGEAFTAELSFRKPASKTDGEDLGSGLPVNHALQFKISGNGLLDIYCYYADSIYMVKDGGSATVLAANNKAQKVTKEVSEGTYYLYSTHEGSRQRLYGLKFTPKYTVTLNDNGGNSDGSSSVIVTYNSATIASITNPTKDGYIFGGWYSGSGGTGSLVIDANGDLQESVEGYTGDGGVWTKTAATTLYANWVPKAVYDPDMSTEAKLTATLAAEFGGASRWNLTSGDRLVGTPSDVGTPASSNLTGDKYGLAFKAYSTAACATYDLGAETTIYQLTLKLLLGNTDGSIYIGYDDGSWDEVANEDAVWEDEENAWIEKTFTFNYPAGVSGARYIHVFGNTAYQMGMSQFKVVYAPTKTEIVLDNQSATTAGTESVTATYGASTNLTSSITVPIKVGYVFGGYYTEEAGAGTQLIDANGAWLASKTGYTDGSKNWQFANPDLTLYAKWTQVYASGSYSFDGNLTVGTSPSKTVTTSATDYSAFRVDDIFFSNTNIEFEGTDGTPKGDGDDYKGWKVKASSTIKFFVENNSDVVVSIGSIGDGGSCSISYTNQSNVAQNDVAISAGTYPTYNVKAGTMVTITMSPGSKKSVTLKRIAISTSASCTTSPTVGDGGNSSVAVTTATVTCSSGISSLGSAGCSITSYGFVLNTTGTPTLSDTQFEVGTTYTSTGVSFSKNLTDLVAGTTYYVRPYATNGNGTAYGTQTSFTMLYAITTGSHSNGSVTIPSSAASGATVNISASANTGYSFSSWTIKKSSDGTDVTSSVSLSGTTSASFTMPEYGVTVDALFTVNSHTLSWNINGGGCTETAGDDYTAGGSVNYGTTITFPSNSSMSKPGYEFNGWSDGTSTYEAGDAYTMPDDDVEFTAQWTSYSLPNVTGLDVDDGATLSSIPLSWTIPGICDLKGWTDPLVIPNNGRNEYGVLDKSNSSYNEVGDYVTANGNTPIWGQFGVGFNIPETSSLSWLSYEWKGTFYDATYGNDVILCGVSCDDTYAYWKLNGYKTLNDDSQWNESGQQVPNQIYWSEGSYPSPAPEVSQVVIYANAAHDAYDEVTFSVRNVRYGISGQNDIDHVVLMRKEGSAATGPADASATKLYEGTKSHYTDASDVTGKNYYYTVFAVHSNGAVSTGTTKSLTLYTITYDAGANGSGTVAADKKTKGINFTLSSSTFTRDGFTQDGWSESDGGAKVYELGGTYSTDDDITLYPHWVADAAEDITNGNPSHGTISITDGVSSLSKASAGATVTITATPATGYNFTSWDVYKTGDASTKVSTAAATASTTFIMPAYAVTVNASFSAKTYTVTLNGNGGSGNTANVTATYNSSTLSSSITNPTKTGYIFGGWYSGTGGTGSLVIDASGDLQASVAGYTGAGGIWTKDATATLYAKWITVLPATLNKSNVTAVSGDMEYYSTNYFDYGSEDKENLGRWAKWDVYLIPCKYSVSMSGYYPNCHRWKISIVGEEKSFTFDEACGTGNQTDNSASDWDLSDLSAGVYTIIVENIKGWSQPKLLSLTLSATVYTVTYDANGGTCGTASETVCGGDEVTLPSALGDGEFEGWYTSSDEEIGGAGDSYKPTADITLYAHWGASCSDPEEPTAFAATEVKMNRATFSITDDENAASYDLYYASGSPSTPTAETTATENVVTKTPTITGLSSKTTYKIWVRSVCDATHKSDWVALGAEGGAFTTPAPETYSITYNKDGATEDQISDGEKTEGTNFTLSLTRYTKTGYWQVGWATSQGGSKVYDFGGTYSTDADLALYPAWVPKAEYEKSLCVTALSELTAANTGRWSFTTGDLKVDLPSEFGGDVEENLTGDKCGLAYAKQGTACAKYDIGAQGKLYQLTITMISEKNNGGCCVQLLKANGTFAVDQAHSELSIEWPGSGEGWQKKTATFTFPTGQDDVQKIYIFGSGSSTLCLQSIKLEYEPSSTYIVLDNQSATSAGTANVTATYGASTNLTSSITVPTKTGYTFGGYYTEAAGAGTQLIDKDGAWIASKTGYTDGSKNWQFANPDLTLYAKWSTLTALEAGTLYEVPDMIPEGESLSSSDQFFEGLSANTKFTLIGSASSSTTPKVNNSSSNDRTIAGITFDDGSMWFKGNATVSENIPSTFGLSFIVPSAGKLYLYFDNDDTSTNIKLAKSGEAGSKPTVSSGYSVVDVTSGTYYMYGTSTSSPYSFYGLKFVPTYDITLHDNDGGSNNGSAAVAVNGTTLLDIDAPTRSGYAVTGYYAEAECTTLVADAEGNLEEDVTVDATDWTDEDGKWIKGSGATLYAKWVVVYTVTFNTNGGSLVDAITQTSEGGSITMPAAPTKDGYTFQGWYIGSTSYAVSASYTPTADITAYASWKAECGVIKWDFTGYTEGDISLTESASTEYTADDGATKMRYTAGSGDKIIAPNKGKLGYFKENGNTSSGSYKDTDGETAIGKNRLIRLFVEAGSGTLRINCNGDQNGVYKVLDGSASGTTLISSLSANTTSSSITLTTSPLWIETTTKGYINDIRWTPSSTVCYYVTYNGNGADGGYVNDPEAHSSGDNVTTLANSFTRTGCTFTGWNTAADGSGTAYVAGGTISSISRNVTLYAQWKITVSENKNLSEYTSDALSTTDVVVTNGATLTVTEDTEVRNITVETGATLNIATTDGGDGVTFTAKSLHLKGGWNESGTKYDMPRVFINEESSLVKTGSNIVNFDIAVTNSYSPFAVPFRVKVADVDYAKESLASASVYLKHYFIRTYDGENRAKNGFNSDNWTAVPLKVEVNEELVDNYLEPGRGYALAAKRGKGELLAIIRLPMYVDNAWTDGGEKGSATISAVDTTKNAVAVTAWEKGGGATTPKKDKGWNILGVPYMSCFDASDASHNEKNAFIKGKLNFTDGTYSEEANVYVSVPTHDFSEYVQETIDDAVLVPGWCFFVQFDQTGTLTFATAGEEATSELPIYAPKREQSMPTVKTGIILSGAEASDKTTILVSDKYSAADYEINADLEKMFGENGYTLATYSLAGTTRLAYNAMSNSDATNVIPIGYRAPADGEYTFAISPRYAENGAFEHVNLIDYETGFVTDLLVSSYSFATERTQNDTRFALNVVKRQDVITDVTVTGDGLQVTGPQKVIINDKLYIIVDGRMYDAKGAMVK